VLVEVSKLRNGIIGDSPKPPPAVSMRKRVRGNHSNAGFVSMLSVVLNDQLRENFSGTTEGLNDNLESPAQR